MILICPPGAIATVAAVECIWHKVAPLKKRKGYARMEPAQLASPPVLGLSFSPHPRGLLARTTFLPHRHFSHGENRISAMNVVSEVGISQPNSSLSQSFAQNSGTHLVSQLISPQFFPSPFCSPRR